MKSGLEQELIRRCQSLHQSGRTTLSEACTGSAPERYISPQRFAQEQAALFRRQPAPYVLSSELNGPHAFRTVASPLGALLISRDEQGQARCFNNVCRHRGAQLVSANAGCSQRHSCPYHAWTYDSAGRLQKITHQDSCFPELKREQLGLTEIACTETHGLIWACPDAATPRAASSQLQSHLAGLDADLTWLDLERNRVFRREQRVWQANWKLIAEGGLESYHFRFAHKDTIAPFFLNNCMVQDVFHGHFRTVLPTTTIMEADANSSLRAHSHIVYALLPMTTFLVQEHHIDWISARPIAADQTEITLTSLVPTDSDLDEAYWDRNFAITDATLAEDFAMAESIQRGLSSGANTQLNFGRNEGALATLNQRIDEYLAAQ